jgi:glycine cleavage system aminomethyltransferase T
MTVSELDTPLGVILRDHGAVFAVRHGHGVAAHFGSVASETAVCLRSVGLADRFGRVTFDVRGGLEAVAAALTRLDTLGGCAWGGAVAANHAVVRCERSDEGACRAVLDDDADLVVEETKGERAALGLVGPRAEEVLHVADLGAAPFAATVLRDRDGFEILVPRRCGPEAWMHLLRCGRPFDIACVGFDALEHLAVSRHAGKP